MATKKAVVGRALFLGATIDDDASAGVIYADAPRGHRWSHTGTHTVASPYDPGCGNKSDAWREIAADMADGVEPCPTGGDENCYAYGCPVSA